MNRNWMALGLALLLLTCAARANEAPVKPLHQVFQEFAAYEFGQSRAGLIIIENACLAAVGDRQQAGELEKQLLAVLKNENAKPDAKRFACRMLSLVGSDISTETLGKLLEDPQYVGQALQALEAIGKGFAESVLSNAAYTLEEAYRPAVIAALGRIGSDALPVMAERILPGGTAAERAAMAEALAALESPAACAVLARHVAAGGDAAPLQSGCLACIPVLAGAEGHAPDAFALIEAMMTAETPEAVRARAFLHAAALGALEDTEAEDRRAALVEAGNASGHLEFLRARVVLLEGREDGTAGLAALIADGAPALQVLALEALARRQDAGAMDTLLGALASEHAEVRAAASRALIASRSDAAVDPLFALASGDASDARRSALDALTRLDAPGANARLAEIARTAAPAEQAVALELLGLRRAIDTRDTVITAAESSESAVFEAAHGALRVIAQPEDLPMLLDKAVAENEAARAFQVTAVALAGRLPEGEQTALLTGRLEAASEPGTRATLLSLMGRVGGAQALDTLKAAADDPDPGVQVAVAKALAAWPGPEALGPLGAILARDAQGEAGKAAYDGVVRLIRESKLPSSEAINHIQVLRRAAETNAQKRQLLQAAARVTDLRAFRIAENFAKDEQLAAEAEQTLVELGERLAGAHPKHVQARMLDIARKSTRDALKAKARSVSDTINGAGNYLTAWLVSGPYSLPGKRANDLHDVAFPPEAGLFCGDSTSEGHLGWEVMPVGAKAGQQAYVNLQREFNANECVAYLRTCLYSEINQIVRLSIGSDDGVKVWHNGELRFAKLGMRHYQPEEDFFLMELVPGENSIVVAVYQHASDWGFTAMLTDVKGDRVSLRANDLK